jgi:hypothetical protein
MRADIAIVNYFGSSLFRKRAAAITRWLQNFGLTCEVLEARNVPAGQAGKDYLNLNYRAVLYLENRRADDADPGYGMAYTWLQTTLDSGDIPIAYFGPIPVGQQRYLPSDFPIIFFNSSNPDTYYQFPHFLQFETDTPQGRSLGTRLLFADGKRAWGRAINYLWNSSQWYAGLFRVHLDRLDSNRQVMIAPDWNEMGITPPNPDNAAIGVRYYNRYFLPCLSYSGRGQPKEYTNGAASGDSFCPGLVLWFLEQVGLMPRWKMNVTYDIDHPLPGTESAQGSGMSLAQIRYVDRKTMEWVRDFARSKGLIIQCGVLTGGKWRSRNYQHWYFKDQTADATALHNMLKAEHRYVFPCCWHDHTFPVGRVGDYKRHTGGTFGAPSMMPGFDKDENGVSVLPGTGVRNQDFSLRSREAYRIHWEGSVREMSDMGFPDAWCKAQKYINMAGNEWGNLEFLDFLVDETAVRSLRITSTSALTESGIPNPYASKDFRLLKYRAINLYETQGLDSGMRGLFNPGDGSGSGEVAINQNDVNQWHNLGVQASDSDRERKVRCRYLAHQTDMAIRQYLYINGVLMNHTDFCHAANPGNPTADFNQTGNWNGMKEMFTAVGEWYDILRNWLQPGGIKAVGDWRKQMRLAR